MSSAYKEVAENYINGDLAADLLTTLRDTYKDKVKVRIQTTLSDETLQPLDTKGGGKASMLGKFLKPKVSVIGPDEKEVWTMAPYGEPGDSSGIMKAGAIALGVGFCALIFGAGRLSKR